ncbi:Sec-independent protein translocase protein TatB [Thalassocella blandensis]|nr:Sec-independent protein translocase protein TatB [Thalassocella blandensis]
MSFAELFTVLVVGLIIVGPDRLPHAIKSGLIWINRVKRMLHETRSEFENQLGMDEIRREIHNEQVMASLKALEDAKKKLQETGSDIGNEIESSLNTSANSSTQQSPSTIHSTAPDSDSHTIHTPAKRVVEENFEDDEHLFGEQLGNHPERDNAPDAPSEANNTLAEKQQKHSH